MKYCRTNEAVKWMNDGDVIQNLESEEYYKKEGLSVFVSHDTIHWKKFELPMEIFPPYEEWRSITNLHYYDEVEGDKMFLTSDDRPVTEDDPEADKNKKRWYPLRFYKGE